MNTFKPRLAIVSSHNICCGLAYYATALKDLLTPSFEVEIIDLKTNELLRQEGKHYQKMSDAYIDELCAKLQEFDVINVHLELGIYGTKTELILPRILKICQASGRLIFTVHTIDYKEPNAGHFWLYEQVMGSLKRRPSTNPFHLIAHLPHENALLRKHFGFSQVTDFPLILLTNEQRKYFQEKRNPTVWKKQFGLTEEDLTIGIFGLMSAHKNYLHALRTLNLLPTNYKLLIIGEAHPMSIKEWQVDSVIQEIVTYLDNHPTLADRVVFTGKRDNAKYYEDVTNIDFALFPSFEVGQSGSGTLSSALELSCAILKSNTYNCREYEIYFPDCFETFDIGNYYETKNKIINFDRMKIENLKKRVDLYSEVQLQQMYLTIYESMKNCIPAPLSKANPAVDSPQDAAPAGLLKTIIYQSKTVRALFDLMPSPIQSLLRRAKRKLTAL